MVLETDGAMLAKQDAVVARQRASVGRMRESSIATVVSDAVNNDIRYLLPCNVAFHRCLLQIKARKVVFFAVCSRSIWRSGLPGGGPSARGIATSRRHMLAPELYAATKLSRPEAAAAGASFANRAMADALGPS